jgi:hypothetical protein
MTPADSQAQRDATAQVAMEQAKANPAAKAPEKMKSKADTRYGNSE